MIISYLIDIGLSKLVLDQESPDLLDLIRLGLAPFRLQVHDLLDAIACKDVVAAPHPFDETKADKQLAKR
ncbi:MAG: hypothetical protein JNL68_18945 [Burkholderiales bacterium]|nr:hypothetical protein [Burkholderiales bacterium]